MQFIPSTWALYGTDGDGDGVANPFDVNDAALTAARYLCAAGGDLRTHDGQVTAVLSYNHSDQYVAQVLALADAYRRGIPVSGVPVGETSGPLPPVSGGPVPPANPGSALADSSKPGAKSSSSPAAQSTAGGGAAGGSGSGGSGSTGGGATGGGSGGSSTPAGSTSAPAPQPSTTPIIPTPTPSGTRTCVLWDLLNPGHCAMWK
jgi:hypothetical protein